MDVLSATHFVRAAACVALNKGDLYHSENMAVYKYGQHSVPAKIVKSIIVGTSDAGGDVKTAVRSFISLVQGKSLIGKIASVRSFAKIPSRTRVLVQDECPIATWVGEGVAVAPAHTSFNFVQLNPLKAGTEIILTNELLSMNDADFESQLSRDLIKPIANLEGVTFIDPINAGLVDVSPASITAGVDPIPSSGVDANSIRQDIANLFAGYTGSVENAVLCMNPLTALHLCLMQASLGEHGLTINGGTLFGVPVVTSDALTIDSNGAMVVLLDPSRIAMVDNGVILSASKESTVSVIGEDEEVQLISLWQENLYALQAIRLINWEVLDQGSVAWLSGVQW